MLVGLCAVIVILWLLGEKAQALKAELVSPQTDCLKYDRH